MISRIPNPLFFILALLLALGLYWPSLNGMPVWDDFSFMFEYHVIIDDFSYLTIWKNFNWPLSVSLQKILFHWWQYEYLNYHLLNFCLHFANSFLLFKVAEKLKLPAPRLLFLFFLLHPANVISVSWMIQLKTLLCFFFGMISFYCLTKVQEHKKWYALAWLTFALSLLSKTASISLPIIFFCFLYKKIPRKEWIWLIPFFVLSITAGYRILKSPTKIADVQSLIPAPEQINPEQINPEKIIPAEESSQDFRPMEEASPNRTSDVLSTARYYFWHTLLPFENQPVKGLNYSTPGAYDYLNILFLILIVAINWGTIIPIYLGLGYVLLLPFMGILHAPYMNVAWVSDQHLYLALPLFLCFWLSLINLWKLKYVSYLPYLFLPFFCYKVAVTTPYYKDEIVFYEACLEADVLNVPIAYNLAVAYLQRNEINQALNVTGTTVKLAEIAPELSKHHYFPLIYQLHLDIQNMIKKKSQ